MPARHPSYHLAIPIEERKHLDEASRREKCDYVNQMTKALHQNVDKVDQFCKEFDALMQRFIEDMQECRRKWLQEMRREKQGLGVVIFDATQEAFKCLDLDTTPDSRLGQLMWSLAPDKLLAHNCPVEPPNIRGVLDTLSNYQTQIQELYQRFNPQGPRETLSTESKIVTELQSQLSTPPTLPANLKPDSAPPVCNAEYTPGLAGQCQNREGVGALA